MMRLAFAALLIASLGFGQSNVASLTGIVTDSSGALVAEAEITISNLGTGLVFRTRSNQQGVYSAPSLAPGRYRVEAQAPGFKRNQVNGLTLDSAQRARLDFTLEVGDVQQAIEVQASVTPLNQESAEISETITATEIRNMPLNSRAPYSLLMLTPGAFGAGNDPSNLDYAENVVINGGRRGGNTFVVDGASTTHIGGIAERIGSIETIQEFKVLASTFSAEYGRTSGAVITFQVKSGTKDYHGVLYEFLRNSALNANEWANNARGTARPVLIRNEFGGTLGGPVPRMNNRMFFFAGYEGVRDSVPVTKTRTIPDPAIRGGNFSGMPAVVSDPLSGNPFPNNTIPASRQDPAAQKFLALFPNPNMTGIFNPRFGISTANWVRIAGRSDNKNFGTMRLDYSPTDKDKFFFTYSHVNEGPRDLVRDFENVLNTEIGPRYRNIRRAALNYTRFFAPNFSGEFQANMQRDPRVIDPWYPEFDVTKELGIRNKIGPNLPQVSIGGGYGSYGDSRFQNWVHQPASASNIYSWLRGRHSIRFGGQLYQNQFWYIAANQISGTYSFNGEITGRGAAGRDIPINSLADLLLGAVKSANYPVPQIPVNRYNYNLGLFFNDDWKATNKLTLNLGLRYEFETRQAVKNNVYSRVDPVTGQLLVAGRNASRNLNLNNDYINFSPRFGAAYSLSSKTVLRTGLAVSHANFWVDNGEMVAFPGWTAARTFVDQGLGRAQPFTFSQGFPVEGATAVPDPLAAAAAATVAAPLSVASVSYHDNDDLPYTYQWSVSVQREVGFNTVMEAAYVGNRSLHLARNVGVNNLRLDQAPAVVIDRRPAQQLRPFPTVSAFSAVFYDAKANYNSLQIKATRRFSQGLSVDANYTWSKSMDNATTASGDSFQIPWQYHNIEWALSRFDRTQVFTLGTVYELPLGRGKRWANHHPIARAVLGGFQLNGLISASSGNPFTITQNNTNLVLASQRPDVIDPSNLSGRAANVAAVGFARRYLILPNEPNFPFRASSNLGIGNLGRNTMREPGYWNVNASIFRSFAITEKLRLELRGEAFNAFNHVNYLEPASTNINNASYGLITGAAPARQIQVGARVSW